MLRILRKNAGSWIIKALLALIILVFIFWGVGSYDSKQANRVASVNGESIPIDAYRTAYNNMVEQYRQNFGKHFNQDMIKMLGLEKQVVQMLIRQKLILSEAQQLNVRVTDQELEASIKNMDAFKTDGKFDIRRYQRLLSFNRMTAEEFEASQRNALLREKLGSLITDGVKVSENEAKLWYEWRNTATNIRYVLFKPDDYTDVEPTEEEIEQYFESHKNNYKTPEERNVQYVKFDIESYTKDVALPPEKIKSYYDEHLDEYTTPKKVHARHILLKLASDAADEMVEKRKQEISDILKQAKAGQDFAELAKQYSEGPTKDKGGDLGFFEKKTMVKPFADKAFAMKPGEISEPVRTNFGWHIIKVEAVNEGKKSSLDEVKDDIDKTLREAKAKEMAYEEANSLYETTVDGDDLTEKAKENELTVHTTGFFPKDKPFKDVKDNFKFTSTAFGLPLKEISDVNDFGDGYYILQVIEKKEPQVPELAAVKEKVKKALVAKKQDEKAKAEAQDFLTVVREKGELVAEAEKIKKEVIETGFFKRGDTIPKIGSEANINDTAFKLSKDKPIAENALKGGDGYYVIAFKERKTPEADLFEKEKKQTIEQLLKQKRPKVFESWIANLEKNSDIEIEDRFKSLPGPAF